MDTPLWDMNRLYDAYLASMKGSSWKEEPQRFEMDFLRELTALSNELEAGTYRTSEGTEFRLNERGKIRHIHGGRMRDRVVRHSLCDGDLQEALHPFLIHNNGASQKGKGLTFARKMFERDLHNYWLKYRTNEGYVGFVDLSKFYDNIRHDRIRDAVYPKIGADARRLMDEVLARFSVDVSYMSDEEYSCCMETKFDSVRYYEMVKPAERAGKRYMPKGVNIGDQVSQEIGIFFPTPIDNYVKIVRGCRWYGRYMDDMYIICRDRDELKSIITGIVQQAEALGLFINEKKTRIAKLSGTYKYLQVKYTLNERGRVIRRINPRSVTRERRRLKAYRRLMGRGEMTYEDINQACRSWMGDYSRIMSRQQIHHMKSIYQELFGKELIWKQQKSFSKTERKSKPPIPATASSQHRSRSSRRT